MNKHIILVLAALFILVGTTYIPTYVKSNAVASISTSDATDLASALTLINELKAKLNSKLQADRNSGQQAT